jgi:phosphatidate cytidylyltransferase
MSSQSLIVLGAAGSLFAAGAIVILLARLFGLRENLQTELWAIYFSEFLIVGAVLIPAALGEWVFTLFLVLLCLRGQFEFVKLFALSPWTLITLIALGAGGVAVALPWFGYAETSLWLLLLGAAAVFVFGFLLGSDETRSKQIGANLGCLVFPALFCLAAAMLRNDIDGFFWIVVVYATVEANDSFALLAGKLFGTRPAFPRLSPGKTIEGVVSGIVGGGTIGALLAYFLLGLPPVFAVVLVFALLVAGIGGDLATSALKRRRGEKDFQPVLNRHGGVLDIYDALLSAMPVALAFQFFWNASS